MDYRKIFPEIYKDADALQIMGGTPKTEFGNRINLLVWNMLKASRKTWETDFRRMLENKDLLLLQESVINTRHDAIFHTQDPLEWVMAKSHRDMKTLAVTGVKTGSTVKSRSQGFLVSPDAEPIFKTPKLILATTYPVMGSASPLLVINIHAINFVSFQKYSRQMAQIVEIARDHSGPVILAGDFNTWNDVRHQALLDLTKKMELREVKLDRKKRLHHINRHLDHVFYRGMELRKANVLFTVNSSDHYPIAVEFELSTQS
jgi:endonuclease/exonuclease/phosphatase (EEP) superfamily protein YafD